MNLRRRQQQQAALWKRPVAHALPLELREACLCLQPEAEMVKVRWSLIPVRPWGISRPYDVQVHTSAREPGLKV